MRSLENHDIVIEKNRVTDGEDGTRRRETKKGRVGDAYKCALNINPFERAVAVRLACPSKPPREFS